MFCTTCGSANPDDGRFCQKCRTVLPALGAPATTPPPPRMGAVPAKAIAIAGTFGGRFEVISILGKGGMGVVYKARDLELGEEIAIKVLQAQFASDPNEVARFKREILTARKITHPNVIRIHDFGVADGEAFISMEALPGGTLADRISRGVSIDEGIRIAIGVAEGLAAAHAKDVVHRDIKPHNVLFDEAGTPKLVDFGIARLATVTSRTVGYAGTPHYMSPEQARGAEATRLSDVYALGVLLFEVFTGRLPFQSDSLVGLAMMHANDAPPPPRSVRADLPEAVESVILRALEKDPAKRWQSAKDIADALRSPAPVSRVVTAPPPRPASIPSVPSLAAPSPHAPRAVAPRTRASSFFFVAIALLFGGPIVFALLLVTLAQQQDQHADASATVTDPISFDTPAGTRRVGDCSYVAPSGWTRSTDFEDGNEVFDEAWQAPASARIVAVGVEMGEDLDELQASIEELSSDADLVVEKLERTPSRIIAQVKSDDGTMRGVLIAQDGYVVAGVAPAPDIAGAKLAAENVASSMRCEAPKSY